MSGTTGNLNSHFLLQGIYILLIGKRELKVLYTDFVKAKIRFHQILPCCLHNGSLTILCSSTLLELILCYMYICDKTRNLVKK